MRSSMTFASSYFQWKAQPRRESVNKNVLKVQMVLMKKKSIFQFIKMISWDPTEFTAQATASFNLCQQDGEMDFNEDLCFLIMGKVRESGRVGREDEK